MIHLSGRRDFQWPMNSQRRATVDARERHHHSTATNTYRDLFPVIAMCAIGLLATLIVMLRFPDLGALIESYNKF
jgi:hypothetical protein